MRSATVAHSRVIGGRYALEERLGRGRFGEIYSALDMRAANEGESEKRVAIQVVHSSIGGHAKLRERFTTGFARIRSWSHPNIVRLLELGREGGTLYVTMERLEGASMRQILNDLSPGTIDPDESLAVIRQIGDALRHAHARGMVHGDVRPDNVFVTHDYAVKLLDFAPVPVSPLAVLVDDATPQGSPLAKVRDDVYGLACLAYELLSGRHPFGGSLLDEARQAGLEPVPIAGIPRQQWQALKRALDLSAEVTPVSVSEFLDEFGITGTESLPISEPSLPAPEPFVIGRRPATPPLRYGDESLTATRRQRAWEPPSPAPETKARDGRRILRPVVLALIAIALGVVTREYYWPMREATADLYARYLPAILPPAETPTANGVTPAASEPEAGMATVRVEPSPIAPPVTIDTSSAPTTSPEVSDGPPAAPMPSAGDGETVPGPSSSEASAAVPAPAAAADRQQAAATTPPPSPSTLPGPEDQPAASVPASSVPAPAAAAARETPPAPATIAFVDSFVTVPEFGSAARVVLRRSGGRASDTVEFRWWTSEDTAMRDDDFADLGARIASFEAGEPTATIFVPIIEDSKPEPSERFFVHVELQTEGAAARPMRAEVLIIDDDS